MDIINVIDIVSLVSTIWHFTSAQWLHTTYYLAITGHTQICWRRGSNLHSEWLARRPNPSFEQALDQVHFGCRRLRWRI